MVQSYWKFLLEASFTTELAGAYRRQHGHIPPSALQIHSGEQDAKIANVKVTFPSGNTWRVKKCTGAWVGMLAQRAEGEEPVFPSEGCGCHVGLDTGGLFASGTHHHHALTTGKPRNSPQPGPTRQAHTEYLIRKLLSIQIKDI